MALKLSKETQYGVNCEYWKVTTTNIDWFAKTASIIMDGFLNEQARQDRKQPLDQKRYSYIGDTFPFAVTDNLVAKSYEIIKATDFGDAIDC